jgi:hypothetical protein
LVSIHRITNETWVVQNRLSLTMSNMLPLFLAAVSAARVRRGRL